MTEVSEAAPAVDQAAPVTQVMRNVEVVRTHNRSCYVSKYNPRKSIDKLYVAWLAGSIRAQGILQRPVARQVEVDGEIRFELIFGQCRFLANSMAFGDDGLIDLDVCTMTDEEAMLAAQTENTVRKPMTTVEEAEGAALLLAKYQGDREFTAKELGWARAKLDTMLKLMACSERVRKQLTDAAEPLGKMPIGVAELLAGLPYAQQDKCMDSFVRRGSGFPAIEVLKAEIQQLSKSLNAAIFDKAECTQCPHNSAQQRAMFDTGLDDGFCLKSVCYDEKTEGELTKRCAELKDDYQVVRIVRPSDKYSVIKLAIDGPTGVGEEQAAACRTCANFGAAVSAVPDKLGKIARALCFDTACNQQKVQAHQASIALQPAAPAEPTNASADQAPASDSDVSESAGADEGGSKPSSNANSKAGDKPKAQSQTPTVTLTSGVLEYRDRLYRTVIAKEIASSSERGFAMLLGLAAARRISAVSSDTMADVLKQHAGDLPTGSVGKNFTCAMALASDKLALFVARMGATCSDSLSRDELVDMVKQLKPDWRLHFTLGEDFLKVLTKSEIQAVAMNVGLDKACGKEFKSLFAKKKDEIIKALTTVKEFDYVGALPSVLKPGAAKR
jgi:ParB family chromosome partitioning protein